MSTRGGFFSSASVDFFESAASFPSPAGDFASADAVFSFSFAPLSVPPSFSSLPLSSSSFSAFFSAAVFSSSLSGASGDGSAFRRTTT